MPGRCCLSSAGRRDRPPEVVSPLILPLTTLTGSFCCFSRRSSSATQPLPRAKPYSAERLSPSTSIVRLGASTADP